MFSRLTLQYDLQRSTAQQHTTAGRHVYFCVQDKFETVTATDPVFLFHTFNGTNVIIFLKNMSQSVQENIYLIGAEEKELSSCCLPTIRQILSVCHYKQRMALHINSKKIISGIINDVYVIWEKLNVPLHQKKYSIERIIKLRKEYQSVQKSVSRKSCANHQIDETFFLDKLDNIFDVRIDRKIPLPENLDKLLTAEISNGNYYIMVFFFKNDDY